MYKKFIVIILVIALGVTFVTPVVTAAEYANSVDNLVNVGMFSYLEPCEQIFSEATLDDNSAQDTSSNRQHAK